MAKAETITAELKTPKSTVEVQTKEPGSRRIPVKHAYFHQAVNITQLGMSEKHLGKAGQPITMEWAPEGLWLIPIEEKFDKLLVPASNVAYMVMK